MVTNAEEPETEPTVAEKAVDAAYVARDTVADAVRYTVSGDKRGRIRRGVLYLIAITGVIADLPLPAIAALTLLVFTDNVIEVSNE